MTELNELGRTLAKQAHLMRCCFRPPEKKFTGGKGYYPMPVLMQGVMRLDKTLSLA
ncbi:unnamed protein product [Ilex paraguariensis]|uniref:Uncharacterized protein n=1 Tax=Ilex paraguariensis TaxID=185542 RepID=A0ABC8V0S6_9AQUA